MGAPERVAQEVIKPAFGPSGGMGNHRGVDVNDGFREGWKAEMRRSKAC